MTQNKTGKVTLNKQNIIESLVIFGMFTAILLPLRLFFYNYLQDHWLGTFGVTSLVIFSVFYLSKKGKLGNIGNIIVKHIERKAQSKWILLIIGQSIFFIYFCSIMVMGITNADPNLASEVKNILEQSGIKDIDTLFQPQTLEQVEITPEVLIIVLYLIFIPSELSAVVYKVFNDFSNGLVLSFFTIFLIEEIEVLGITLFLRLKTRIKNPLQFSGKVME